MGERIKGVKVWELMGWDKESLLGKVKAVCTSKENKEFTTSHWQADVQPLLRRQSLSCVLVSWENKCHQSESSLSSSFHPAFIAEQGMIRYEISLWSQLSWLYPLPAPHGQSSMRSWNVIEKSCCSAITERLVRYQSCFHKKKKKKIQNTASYKPQWRKLTLSQWKPWHVFNVGANSRRKHQFGWNGWQAGSLDFPSHEADHVGSTQPAHGQQGEGKENGDIEVLLFTFPLLKTWMFSEKRIGERKKSAFSLPLWSFPCSSSATCDRKEYCLSQSLHHQLGWLESCIWEKIQAEVLLVTENGQNQRAEGLNSGVWLLCVKPAVCVRCTCCCSICFLK